MAKNSNKQLSLATAPEARNLAATCGDCPYFTPGHAECDRHPVRMPVSPRKRACGEHPAYFERGGNG